MGTKVAGEDFHDEEGVDDPEATQYVQGASPANRGQTSIGTGWPS